MVRVLAVISAGCALAACREATSPARIATPSEVVRSFYAAYHGNFRQTDATNLSNGLRDAITSAISIEEKSRAAIKAGPFPSDKPQLLEGEIFAGLYEGFTGHQVSDGKTNGPFATVDVRFTNSHYSVGWTDRVQLVEENGWKIDDVSYLDKKAGAKGLRDILRDFQQLAARDPLLRPQQR